MNKKYLPYLIIGGKISLLIIFLVYLFSIRKSETIQAYHDFLQENPFGGIQIFYLVFSILLMPLNWYLESRKFSCFFQSKEQYTELHIFKTIISGIVFALITPMKLGEYAGRLVLINRKDWSNALIATFLGNCCQWIALAIFGIVGLQFMLSSFNFKNPILFMLVNVMLLLVTGLLIYLWYKKKVSISYLLKFIPAKYANIIRQSRLNNYRTNWANVFKACVFAALRYIIYTLQLVLLLRFFGTDIGFAMLFGAVCTIYFFQLILPFLNWLGLIGRTGIAIFVLKSLGVNEMITGISTFGVWIINMILPSILGLYFIFQYRQLKKVNNEKESMDL